MPLFNPKEFAQKVLSDVQPLWVDYKIFSALPEQEKRNVLKEVANIEVNLPILSERMEAMIFGFAIDMIFEGIQSLKKKMATINNEPLNPY